MSNLNDLPLVTAALQALAPGVKIEPKVTRHRSANDLFREALKRDESWPDSIRRIQAEMLRYAAKVVRKSDPKASNLFDVQADVLEAECKLK